jgi:hypothetical protein
MSATAASTAPVPSVSSETLEDRRSSWPAALAALAEAAFLFVPLHVLAEDSGRMSTGPLDRYWQFALMYGVGVFVLTRLRRFKAALSVVAGCAILLGVAQADLWGRTDLGGLIAMQVFLLFVGFRVAMLGLRDWRDPLREEFAVGAIALLAEMGLVGGDPALTSLLPFLVIQFFVAALASRAASMRLARPTAKDAADGMGGPGPQPWLRATVIALGALAGLLLLAVALGGRSGALAMIGRVVLGAVGAVFGFVILLIADVLIGPMSWVVDKLNLDLSGFRRVAETLRQFGQQVPHAQGGGSDPVVRLLGFAVLAAIAFLLFRAIRRHFQLLDRRAAEPGEPSVPSGPLGPRGRRPRGRRTRREMPADTVRRWYAEALLMLARRGMTKPPSRTPGEYLSDVRAAYPECAADFGALTRAYERVRYGSRMFEGEALNRLEAQRNALMGTLHRASKFEPAHTGTGVGNGEVRRA